MKVMVLLFLSLLNMINCIAQRNAQIEHSTEVLVKDWNTATILSLDEQIKLASDSLIKSFYLDRMKSFKLVESSLNYVKGKSLRHRFIDAIFTRLSTSDQFYVVESTSGGEIIEICKYLIVPSAKGFAMITIFRYEDGDWVSTPEQKVIWNVNKNLKEQFANLGQGVNQEDVIISYVRNVKIVSSQYFLSKTLPSNSEFVKILRLK